MQSSLQKGSMCSEVCAIADYPRCNNIDVWIDIVAAIRKRRACNGPKAIIATSDQSPNSPLSGEEMEIQKPPNRADTHHVHHHACPSPRK